MSFFPTENSWIDSTDKSPTNIWQGWSRTVSGQVWKMIYSKPNTGSVWRSGDPLFDSIGSCAHAHGKYGSIRLFWEKTRFNGIQTVQFSGLTMPPFLSGGSSRVKVNGGAHCLSLPVTAQRLRSRTFQLCTPEITSHPEGSRMSH